MNKNTLAASMALLVCTSTTLSYADGTSYNYTTAPSSKQLTESSASSTLGSVLGAVVAGPVGIIAGAVSGNFLDKKLSKAKQYDELSDSHQLMQAELADINQRYADLQKQFLVQGEKQKALHALAMSHLEFQILFHTGNDILASNELQRLDELAEFLKSNPQLSIRLHGHADPRGSDEYNNVLSLHRAKNVRYALEARGIDSQRIEDYFYGADRSQAHKGDLDAYAFERRVTIEVYDQEDNVAAID